MYRNVERAVQDATRELALLKHLHRQPRCSLVSHLRAWRKTDGKYLLFFECFPCDLGKLLMGSQRRHAHIDVRQAMRFAFNLSTSLAYLHSCHVIHRDVKPANILLRACSRQADPWEAVVADFGNSAILHHDEVAEGGGCSVARWAVTGQALTRRVCTLWYAAPEMLLPRGSYGFPADIWSLGLVLLEIEAQRAACPTRPDASDWEQLLAFWRLCQPAAATRGFLLRVRLELNRWQARPWLLAQDMSLTTETRARVGRRYGPRFRAFAFRLLEMEPQQRVAATSLSTSCQQTFRHWVALPCSWLLDC